MFVQGSVTYDEQEATSLWSRRTATRLGNYSWMKRRVTTRTQTPLSSYRAINPPANGFVLSHRKRGGG